MRSQTRSISGSTFMYRYTKLIEIDFFKKIIFFTLHMYVLVDALIWLIS